MRTRRTFAIGEIDIAALKSDIDKIEAPKRSLADIVEEIREETNAAIGHRGSRAGWGCCWTTKKSSGREDFSDARLVRDAEANNPGIVGRSLDDCLTQGKERKREETGAEKPG